MVITHGGIALALYVLSILLLSALLVIPIWVNTYYLLNEAELIVISPQDEDEFLRQLEKR